MLITDSIRHLRPGRGARRPKVGSAAHSAIQYTRNVATKASNIASGATLITFSSHTNSTITTVTLTARRGRTRAARAARRSPSRRRRPGRPSPGSPYVAIHRPAAPTPPRAARRAPTRTARASHGDRRLSQHDAEGQPPRLGQIDRQTPYIRSRSRGSKQPRLLRLERERKWLNITSAVQSLRLPRPKSRGIIESARALSPHSRPLRVCTCPYYGCGRESRPAHRGCCS